MYAKTYQRQNPTILQDQNPDTHAVEQRGTLFDSPVVSDMTSKGGLFK